VIAVFARLPIQIQPSGVVTGLARMWLLIRAVASAFSLRNIARTPFALMHQCQRIGSSVIFCLGRFTAIGNARAPALSPSPGRPRAATPAVSAAEASTVADLDPPAARAQPKLAVIGKVVVWLRADLHDLLTPWQ
jgi:hypothetical protein